MAIPKQINPDFLKDSIVNFRFKESQSPELIVGLAYSKLSPLKYSYTPGGLSQVKNGQLEFRQQNPLLHKENIKISLTDQLTYNHNRNYPGWESFFKDIKETYSLLTDELALYSIPLRIGLRYINTIPDTDIFEYLKGDLVTINTGTPEKAHFKFEFDIEGYKCIVNLGNGALIQGEVKSIVDIDIVYLSANDEIMTAAAVFDKIEHMHQIEKKIFFEKLIDSDKLFENQNVTIIQ